MSNVIVGIIAIVAGAVFCFRGYWAMRTVIGLWAGFVGFGLGAGLFAATAQQPPLAEPMSWVAAIVVALLLAWLAYAFYAAAVILTMGSVGFAVGGAIGSALGLSGGMFILAGLAGGLLLVLIAVVTNLPALLLIVATALGGGSAIVIGIALLMGWLPVSALTPDAAGSALTAHTWLVIVELVLVVAGVLTQLRRRSTANLRAGYR